jgi:hypothetical protein
MKWLNKLLEQLPQHTDTAAVKNTKDRVHLELRAPQRQISIVFTFADTIDAPKRYVEWGEAMRAGELTLPTMIFEARK